MAETDGDSRDSESGAPNWLRAREDQEANAARRSANLGAFSGKVEEAAHSEFNSGS